MTTAGGSSKFIETAIDKALSEQLESLPDLGTDIEDGGFYARAADHPIGYSVKKLFVQFGRPAAEFQQLYDRFEVWLVPHRISIIRRSGMAEPISVGIEVKYQNWGKTCSIVSLFPSFQFIEHGRVSLNVEANLSANGELKSGGETPTIEDLNVTTTCGASLKASAGIGIGLRLTSTVVTPIISCVGVGSSQCEWRFEKQTEPLFGKDIETWAIVVLPKRQRQLTYSLRFYFIARTIFVPTRRQSDWITVECSLG